METTLLIRTGSGSFQFPSTPAEHHHVPLLSRTRSAGAAGFSTRSATATVHLEMTTDHHQPRLPNKLLRAASCDSIPAASFHANTGSPAILSLGVSGRGSGGSSASSKSVLVDEEVELEFSGGGAGVGSRVGGGVSGDRSRGMGPYYREMLLADPENPLLLMNYGRFLHEVEADLQGAEDCFARAVLASPADGQAHSLYGNLMWEAYRDEQRADDYHQRAVQAAPDDCYILASYAHFLWDADQEEDDVEADNSAAPRSTDTTSSSPSWNAVTVKAY